MGKTFRYSEDDYTNSRKVKNNKDRRNRKIRRNMKQDKDVVNGLKTINNDPDLEFEFQEDYV